MELMQLEMFVAMVEEGSFRRAADRVFRTKQFDVGVIFSQDGDLAELVEEVKAISREQNRWIRLASAFPFGEYASYDRGIAGTEWVRIDQATYDACLDSFDYRPKRFQ